MWDDRTTNLEKQTQNEIRSVDYYIVSSKAERSNFHPSFERENPRLRKKGEVAISKEQAEHVCLRVVPYHLPENPLPHTYITIPSV